MNDGEGRDLRALIPGFAFIVVLAGALALAPSVVPAPVRDLLGFGHDRLEPAVRATTTGSYAFLSHQDGAKGDPVGYDPCREVRIRVNPQGAPDGYLAMVRDVM